MDVYLFIEAEPGLARVVMDALVASGAVDRALVITGEFDVFARIDDVSWDDLAERVLGGVQRVPGIVRTTTAVALAPDEAALQIVPKMPVHAVTSRRDRVALVFLRFSPESGSDTVREVVRTKGVIAFTFVTGEYDAIAQVSGKDFEQVAARVMALRGVVGVERTRTHLVLASTPLTGGRGRSAS